MKRLLKFGLLSLVLSLCVGGGALALKYQKEPVKADAAVNGVTLLVANDSTCSDTKYYSQSDKDKTSLSYTNDLKSTNTAHYTFSSSEGS